MARVFGRKMTTWISWTGIIPDDLVLEILVWLPMKSLMRFRCVSKTWNSLIFNPYFVKLHLEKSSKNTPMLSIWRRRIEGSSFLVSFCSIPCLIQNPAPYFHNNSRRYHFPPYNLDNNLVGTSNGLLCMHHSRFNIFGYEKHRFSFQNPATRTPYSYSPSLSYYCRIFPESDYKLSYGFGYDDRRHTFKVVAMVLDSHTKRSSVRVHDMGDKCWRRTVINFPAFDTFHSNGYFLNDSVNWIGISFEEPEIEKLQIFSYDLKNDTYKYLSVPEVVPKNSTLTSLGVLHGCLYVSFNDRHKYFVVLVLKDVRDETSWIRLLSISFQRLSIASLRMPVFFTVYGDMLLLIRMCNCIIFNLKDNKVERTQPFHIDTPVFDGDILSFDYVPSLISPV